MLHWMSTVKATGSVQGYYLMSTEYHANKYLFNEYIQKHPKLQWYMLCASSPELGKQFHQWLPHLSSKITQLKELAKEKDIREYFTKIYPKTDKESIAELTSAFVKANGKKYYLANKFPNLKQQDIETLSELITDEDILQYEQDNGNG
jgi:uncharacterized protein YchJ